MKILGLYSAHNIPFFKEFSLDLSHEGVTIVRGLNLNVKGMKDRNNGSGKTLLLSGIAEVLIGSNPTIERNEVIARRALFPNPDSQITLCLDDTMITKGRFGGQAVSYGIESDNGGMEKVKRDVAQDYLANNIGYNEDAFYSLVYLDGGKEFPLIVGSPIQRIQFLSNIFSKVEAFDQLLQYFNIKGREFGAKSSTYYTLEDELGSIEETLEDGDNEDVSESDVAELEKKLSDLKTRLTSARKQLSNSEMASTFLTLTKNIERLSEKLDVPQELAVREFSTEGARRKILREYNTAKADYKSLTYVIEDLDDKITKLKNQDLDDSRYDLIENSDAYASTYRAWGDFIQGSVNDATIELSMPFRVRVPQTVEDLKDTSVIIEFCLMALVPFGSVIGKQSSKSPFSKSKSMGEDIRLKLISELGKARSYVQTMIDKSVDIGKLGETLDPKEIKSIKRARRNRLELEDLLEEQTKTQRKLDLVRDRLSGIEKPKVRSLEDYDLLGEMVRDIQTLSSLGMTKVNEDLSESKIEKIRLSVTKLEEEILDTSETIVAARAAIKFREENESVVDGIKSRMSKLQKYTRAVHITDALKKAFSNKGIRVMLLNQLALSLATRMNENSHLTFPEPMEFSFDLSDKGCDITVTRNPRTKNEVVSDVRVLSRGERKSFSLLLLYSLLPMTPSKDRLNIVVLDEMTSNMDAPSKLKIFRDFIPALRDVVPHIIIADTGNLEIDDAREYTIVKQGNESKLVEDESVHQAIKSKRNG